MSRSQIYRILEHPFVYSFFQMLLAPGAERSKKKYYEQHFAHRTGLVLDVGCGPMVRTPPPDEFLVGVDINPSYVQTYVERGAEYHALPKTNNKPRLRCGVVASATTLPFASETFDGTRCLAILHHFADQEVIEIIREMYRVTRPEGEIVVFDAVVPDIPWKNPTAWFVSALDRGEWMRSEAKLKELLQSAVCQNWQMQSFRFSLSRLEGRIFHMHRTAKT